MANKRAPKRREFDPTRFGGKRKDSHKGSSRKPAFGNGRPSKRAEERGGSRGDRFDDRRSSGRNGYSSDRGHYRDRDDRSRGFDSARSDSRGGHKFGHRDDRRDDRRGFRGRDEGNRWSNNRDDRGQGNRRHFDRDDRRGGSGRDDRGFGRYNDRDDHRRYGDDDRRSGGQRNNGHRSGGRWQDSRSHDKRGGFDRRFDDSANRPKRADGGRKFEPRRKDDSVDDYRNGESTRPRRSKPDFRDQWERPSKKHHEEHHGGHKFSNDRRTERDFEPRARHERFEPKSVAPDAPRREDLGDGGKRRKPRQSANAGEVLNLAEVTTSVAAGPDASAVDESVTFTDLGINPKAAEVLAKSGITHPLPIQSIAIPDAVAGRDILGKGRTGSGKTVAFAGPMVTRLATLDPSAKHGRAPRGLVLAPTRELVSQINRTLEPLAKSLNMFTLALVGGVPQRRQVLALKKGVDIVVATPGRLEDLQNQGHLDLDNIRIITVDEADEMCDMGFIEPLERIMGSVRQDAQHMLFSATLDGEVGRLVDQFFSDPLMHDAGDEAQSDGDITHAVLMADRYDKTDVISALAAAAPQSIVFSRTRVYAQRLADDLYDRGVPAVAMHGDLKQHQRQRNLTKISNGDVKALVATDVAARGIHIDHLPLVIQADIADDPKSYVHRSGRTGRAGAAGLVISIITPSTKRKALRILREAEISAPIIDVTPANVVSRVNELLAPVSH